MKTEQLLRVPAAIFLASALNGPIDTGSDVSSTDMQTPQAIVSHEPALLTAEYPTLEERKIDLYTPQEYEYGFMLYFRGSLPVAYRHLGGNVGWFTPQETNEFIQKIKSAKESNRMEALAVLIDPPTTQIPEDSKYAGERVELPADMLTSEQLKEKNVMINNPESGVSLGIRPGAFESGGLFEPLELLRQHTDENVSLEIFMLDAPRVHPAFIDQETYPLQHEFLSIDTEGTPITNDTFASDVRWYSHFQLRFELEVLESQLKETTDSEEIATIQEDILWQKVYMKYFQKLPDKRIVEIRATEVSKMQGGSVDYSRRYDQETLESYGLAGRMSLFIAAQENPDQFMTSATEIIVRPDGTIGVFGFTNLDWQGSSLSVQPEKSYANPKDFPTDPAANLENGEYFVDVESAEAKSISHITRHEIIHAWLWKWLPLLQKHGMLEQLSFYDELLEIEGIDGYLEMLKNNKLEPENNEFIVDKIALKTAEEAFELWVESKFTDDSGFSLVFYTNGPDQKVQISQVQPNIQNTETAKIALAQAGK